MANLLVSTVTVAETLKLSTRRVRQLVELGMPRENRGQYDLAKCMLWYIRHLQREIERRELDRSPESTALRAQRVRLVKAQADREEHSLKILSAQLVPRDLCKSTSARFWRRVHERCEALAQEVASQLVGLNREEIKIVLDEEISKLLNGLAR
jgi:phage terminase Nu1 subunit (DNA packaging protein)